MRAATLRARGDAAAADIADALVRHGAEAVSAEPTAARHAGERVWEITVLASRDLVPELRGDGLAIALI